MNKEVHLPNFLVVGTAKSGTTSIFHYLNQHPDICLPIKESHLFNNPKFFKEGGGDNSTKDKSEIISDLQQYKKTYSFPKRPAEKVGEIGTGYLYDYSYSISKIRETLGDIPIIIILRNPVERAYSSFQHFVKLGKGDSSFEEALLQEESRIENGWDFMWHHRNLGFYYEQVRAFQEEFSKVKVTFFEDLKGDGESYMKSLFEFIGVDPTFKTDTKTIHNQSRISKSWMFRIANSNLNPIKVILRPIFRKLYSSEERRRLKEKARSFNSDSYSKMNVSTRQKLINEYKNDIVKLEKIVHRDLNKWVQ